MISTLRCFGNKVEPLEKVRPAAAYMLTIDGHKEFAKYESSGRKFSRSGGSDRLSHHRGRFDQVNSPARAILEKSFGER